MRRRALERTSLTIGLASVILPCLAATYRVPVDETLIRKAGVIVRGRVLDVVSVGDDDGGIHTDVTLAVDRVLQGHIDGSTLLVRQPGGRLADRAEVYPGIGTFFPEEEVLLMLDPLSKGPYRVTDFALGKFTVHRTSEGREFLRRDGLSDAHVLGGGTIPANGEQASSGPSQSSSGAFVDPDRDAASFERYVREVVRGLSPVADYRLPTQKDDSSRIAEFTFLGSPARWTEFDAGQSITYRDSAVGDSGSLCQPDGCHGVIAAAVVGWNGAPNTSIHVVYGGTDASIGNKCLNALDNQIQFNDPCGEISPLSGCQGTLAVGGFVSSQSSGGRPACPAKGNPTFEKITSAKIVVNNGTGSCLNTCDYTEMITHETGHTLGAGHSDDDSALMAPYLAHGLCGTLRPDDVDFALCSYPACGLRPSRNWGGPPPLAVTFYAGLAGGVAPLSFDYDFGDGTSDTSATPTHMYGSPGTFVTTVTVSDSQGHTCETHTDVTVQPCAPSKVISAVASMRDGLWRAIVTGTGFKKGSVVEINSGSGYFAAPVTKFKTSKKLLAKDVGAIWSSGRVVSVQVVGPPPVSCHSNPISTAR